MDNNLGFTRDQLVECCACVMSDTMREVDSFNRHAFDRRMQLIGDLLSKLPEPESKRMYIRPLIRDLFSINPPDLED
jgi:hypothetical protein